MNPKVAIIEAKPSRNNYESLFQNAFEFDRLSLTSNEDLKKVLRKDVDLKVSLNDYDWVVLVGSEPLKFFTKITSITEYSGRVVEDKLLPVINPAMLKFKPEVQRLWDESRDNIIGYITGSKDVFVADEDDFIGIQDTQEALEYIQAVLDAPYDYIGLDSETSGLYPRDGYVLGLSISGEPDKAAYIDADCVTEEVEQLLQKVFNTKLVVFHNAKFDLAFFEYHFKFVFPRFGDTMLVHYMLDEVPGGHGLKQLALKYTKYGDYERPMYEWMDEFMKEKGIRKADFQWAWIPFDVMKPYASKDAAVTFLLYDFLMGYLKSNKRLLRVYETILLPGARFLTDVQDYGVPFSKARLEWAREEMSGVIEKDVKALEEFAPVRDFRAINGSFNPNSVLQLRRLLFDYLGLQPTGKLTAKGEHSTDAEVLDILSKEHEVPKFILNIRRKGKIKNTYLDKIIPQLDGDGRLRTNFNLHSTTSGRLSSSGKVNMQQIPRDDPIVKGCIKARNGNKIVSIDLGTAEMYYAAVLSGDRALQDAFRSGGNFHSVIAHKVFKLDCAVEDVADLYPAERQAAKAISFGILYGAGAPKIADQVTKDGGSLSVQGAQEVIDDYFKAFPNLKLWIDDNKKFITNNGHIYSFFGRKRRLPEVLNNKNRGQVGHGVRSGLNFLVQSVASDVNLLGAIDAHQELKTSGIEGGIFALVHDSILAEVKEEDVDKYVEIIIRNITKDRGISIPGVPIGCDVEIGGDYSFGKFEKTYGSKYNDRAA